MTTNFSLSKPRSQRTLLAALLAAAATSMLVPTPGRAAGPDQVVEASRASAARQSLKLSQDGFNTLRDIRAARLAIFSGDTKAAQDFVNRATADLNKVKADEMTMHASKPGNWVPIDGQVIVADDFVSTPEKNAHVAAGNKKLREGKADEAIKELKLAEVDVGFSRLLMPVDSTRRQISVASGLLTAERYYEANLALKAAEDGLVVDTVALVETPKPAKSGAAPGK